MKKISIITILDVTNFGTFLQAYALGKVFQQFNVEVEYVDYIRPISSWRKVFFRRFTCNSRGLKGIAASIYGLLLDLCTLRRCKKFLTNRISITRPYHSIEELISDPPQADIYVTGSDQVWNPVHNQGVERAYFLDYANTFSPRCAYASSFGIDVIPQQYADEMICLLKNYKSISVREITGKKWLEQEGFKNIEMVLDPTLLLDRCAWENLANQSKFLKTEPYLLVYSVENDKRSIVSESAQLIAQKLKLKVYYVTTRWFSSRPQCDRKFYFSSPLLFLSIFLSADFAVVSSFHGTAFAVNFNVPFISVSPDRFSARVENLLAKTGLTHRMALSPDVAFKQAEMQIDWDRINEVLGVQRDVSLEYIQKIISM